MPEIITVELDLAKNVFQARQADRAEQPVPRKKLRRGQVPAFFSKLQPCVVTMRDCGGAHHLGRGISMPGHDARLIPPANVKPFVKQQKNDAADAPESGLPAGVIPTLKVLIAALTPMEAEIAKLNTGLRPADLYGHRHPCAAAWDVPQGPRFCGLAQPHAPTAFDRQQTAAGGCDEVQHHELAFVQRAIDAPLVRAQWRAH